MQVIGLFESLKYLRNISFHIGKNIGRMQGICRLRLPFMRFYVITDPELAHKILIDERTAIQKSRFYWKQLKAVIGKSIGTLEGEEWKWLRQLHATALSPKNATQYMDIYIEKTKSYFKNWEQYEGPVDIVEELASVNASVLLKALFRIEQQGWPEKAAKYISDGENSIAWRSKYPWRPFLAWFNGKNIRYKKNMKLLDTMADQAITNTLTVPEEEATLLIDTLVKESKVLRTDKKLSKKDIRNDMIVHLGAGTDSAAVSLGWSIYLVHQHPEVLKKLREELKGVTNGKPLHEGHYKELVYASWVIKETLRLFPPGHAVIRDTIKGVTINKTKLKKRSTLFISIYGIHRNPRIWKDPLLFLPERFAEEKAFSKNQYMPFGAGEHYCIGKYVALPLMTLTLASFIQNFEFTISLKKPIVPLSLSTLKANQPILVKLKKIEQYENTVYKTSGSQTHHRAKTHYDL